MKRRLIELAALGAVLGFLGFVVVASGIVPVKASSGHWPVTRWFLSFALRRSVDTHSMGTKAPELDDATLILRGAVPYDRACAPCHGAPGVPRSGVALQLAPKPPYLPEAVPSWEPAELFYIVKHGIKMTGMPAWPARERDDEVWAVVAFLLRLPDLSAAGYRRLAWPDTGEAMGMSSLGSPAPEVAETCAQCHGPDGLGRGNGAYPRLAGQSPSYLAASLRAYARGSRHSGIMEPVAAALDSATMIELARWYGGARVLGVAVGEPSPAASPSAARAPRQRRAPPASGAPRADPPPDLLDRGETIAREGIPERKVPSCVECHGPEVGPRNPFYPDLAGQYPSYLELQLRLFREERRGGSSYAHIMREVVHMLEAEEAEAVAAWYGSLEWRR